MSFFDEFPVPKPQPVRPPKHQPWQGPESGWIGGWVPWRLLLAKTPDMYAVLREFEVFPSGLLFSLVSTFKPEPSDTGSPMERMRPLMWFAGAGGPRFGVEFADGRKAATGPPSAWGDKEPDRPVLIPHGGGGGGTVWRQGFWLWPLPPPGPLTWVASWEERGIIEQSVVVDANELATAAAEAEKLWESPEGAGAWSGGSVSHGLVHVAQKKKGTGSKKGKSKKTK